MNLFYSFQSDTKLVFIMSFVRGGDLFAHLQMLGTFLEDEVRFIIA